MTTSSHSSNRLAKRISLISLGSLLILSSYFIVSSFFHKLHTQEQESLKRLESIAKTLALGLDGDVYQELLAIYSQKDGITHINQTNLYFNQYEQLKKAQQENQLKTPIYLVSRSNVDNAFFFGTSSAQNPYFRHEYKNIPKELVQNYTEGGVIPRYNTNNGTWLSAFHPVKNSNQQIVGVVVVDQVFENFYSEAASGALKDLIFSVLIVLAFIFFIRKSLKRVISMMKDKEIAEHKAHVKTKFLSTMSHEIRTPMNAVIGLSNILIQENPRKDQVENLQTLKFSADMLLALINDILDFSKIEAGKITFEEINFDLHYLVKNINQSLQIRAKDKDISINLDIHPDTPKFIISDPVRLSQILTNLMGNAIKFTSKGYVCIKLTPLKTENDHCLIRFEVIDTGIGIPQDKFETIFQSFSQADTTTTRKFGGTGLGLSITKRLLEIQKSKIQLKSELGKGSTFFFDLSMKIGVKESGSNQVTDGGEIIINENALAGTEILLVEDNKINVIVAKKFLKKWGILVDVAENGAIAVEKVQSKNYDAVLMDLDMPVLDGYKATKVIRELADPIFQELPIIALSASALSDFRQKAFDAGMNEFVTKPFNPVDLYKTICKFVEVNEEVPA